MGCKTCSAAVQAAKDATTAVQGAVAAATEAFKGWVNRHRADAMTPAEQLEYKRATGEAIDGPGGSAPAASAPAASAPAWNGGAREPLKTREQFFADPKKRAGAAMLAEHRGISVSAARDMLWDDSPDGKAAKQAKEQAAQKKR